MNSTNCLSDDAYGLYDGKDDGYTDATTDDDRNDEDWSEYRETSKRFREDNRGRQQAGTLPRKGSSLSLNFRARRGDSIGVVGVVNKAVKFLKADSPSVISVPEKAKTPNNNTTTTTLAAELRRRRRREASISQERETPRQCFGPGCTRPAANKLTKYCSKTCGLTLALKRLERFLPEGRAMWYNKGQSTSPPTLDSVADRTDRVRLKVVRAEQVTIHNRLIELENKHQQLNQLIARAQEYKTRLMPGQVASSSASDLAEIEQAEPVVCITCSAEVNMRHALRHMEKCFQKMESASLLCSNQKEQSRGTPLFCDAYDSHAKAYCKRLQSVCEHFKEPKYPADAICGFPLVEEVFTPTERFCSTLRQNCTRHVGWERKKRANIDVERYRQLIHLDELLQEEARLQKSLSQRAGLLGIILHRTIDKDMPTTNSR